MADKDDSRALLYVGIGAVAAVGAGYLLWRFALDDKQRRQVKDAASEMLERGRGVAVQGVQAARDLGAVGASKAREAADSVGSRVRHMRD